MTLPRDGLRAALHEMRRFYRWWRRRGSVVDAEERPLRIRLDRIPKDAVLHPTHEEEIPECSCGPIAHPELRFAKAARPMGDRDFHNPIAGDPKERGDKAVQAIIGREGRRAWPPDRAEGACAVSHRFPRHPIADEISDP